MGLPFLRRRKSSLIDGAADAVVYGFLLGQYKFAKYLSDPKTSKTVELVLTGSDDGDGFVHVNCPDLAVIRNRARRRGVWGFPSRP